MTTKDESAQHDYWSRVSADYARWLKEGRPDESFSEWRSRMVALRERKEAGKA